jgi:NitT/TauT family transport system permease protein
MKPNTLKNILYPLLGLVAVLLIWTVASLLFNSTLILPQWWVVAEEFALLFLRGTFYTSILLTTLRAILTYTLALALSLLTAIMCELYIPFRRAFSPIITILRSVPTMSIILLCYLMFSAATSPIIIGFLVAYPLCHAAFASRLAAASPLTEMATVFSISPKNRALYVYLPTLRGEIVQQSTSTLSLTLKVVIASEVIVFTKNSIGDAMYMAKANIETATLLAWTVAAVLLSFLLEGVVKFIDRAVKRKKCL